MRRKSLWFVFCLIGIGISNRTPVPLTSAGEFSLWFLGTDSQLQNASLIEYDVNTQRIVSQVNLPDYLIVDFALWSDDMQYILVGAKNEIGYSSIPVRQICLVSTTGNLIWCKDIELLSENLSPKENLISVTWKPDTYSILMAIETPLSSRLQVIEYDIEQETELSSSTIAIEFTSIDAWEWAIETDRAAVQTYDWKSDSHKIVIIEIYPDLVYNTLENNNALSPKWSSDQKSLIFKNITDPNELGFWLVDWNEDNSIKETQLHTFDSEVGPFAMSGLSISNQVAFVSYGISTYPPDRIASIYTIPIDDDLSQPTKLGEIRDTSIPSVLRVQNLLWSPDGRYIAGEICFGLAPTQCSIEIWTTQGSFIGIETDFDEEKNPIWLE